MIGEEDKNVCLHQRVIIKSKETYFLPQGWDKTVKGGKSVDLTKFVAGYQPTSITCETCGQNLTV